MSRYNGKFGRVQHTGVSMLRSGGHLSGAASPQDPEQPAPQMPKKLAVAAQTARERPVASRRGIGLPAPAFHLEGPA